MNVIFIGIVAVCALAAAWPCAFSARAETVSREQRIIMIKTMEMSFFISVFLLEMS